MKRHPILYGFVLVSLVAVFFYLVILGSFSFFSADDGIPFVDESVGVIEIYGVIDDSEDTMKDIRRFAEDGSIRALLVRIDSPGGVVAPVQEIYGELVRAAQNKPVVASLASTAASGGYYIACAAQTIVANPGTITGSIGVVMEFITGEEAFRMLGLRSQVVKSGELKDTGNIGHSLTRQEAAALQETVDDVHRQFVAAVMAGRNLDEETTRALASGRIYSGAQAKELGLVDELGSLYDAVDLIKERLHIAGKVRLIYPKRPKPSMMDFFLDELTGRLRNQLTESADNARTGRLYFR